MATPSRAAASLACAALSVVLLAACGATAVSPIGAWSAFWGEPHEAERFGTLEDMARGADAVVLAVVEDVSPSRTVGAPQDSAEVSYVGLRLTDVEVLAGAAPDAVSVELTGGSPQPTSGSTPDDLDDAVVGTAVLVFLQEKQGAGEEGLYRPVVEVGLWAATTRAALDTPLRSQPPDEIGLFAGELEGVDDLTGLAALVESFDEAEVEQTSPLRGRGAGDSSSIVGRSSSSSTADPVGRPCGRPDDEDVGSWTGLWTATTICRGPGATEAGEAVG